MGYEKKRKERGEEENQRSRNQRRKAPGETGKIII